MSQEQDRTAINWIVHPTDFSAGADRAFRHALAIAVAFSTKLTIYHVRRRSKSKGNDHVPEIRMTLAKWGHLAPAAPKAALIDDLGLRVKRVNVKRESPADSILKYVDNRPIDLVVLATESRSGLPRWIQPSVAAAVVRKADSMCLFIPTSSSEFIHPEKGECLIQRILIPVDIEPRCDKAIEVAINLVEALAVEPVEIRLLHVGKNLPVKVDDLPQRPGWSWTTKLSDPGDPVEAIAECADRFDLIVMTSAGRRGVLETFSGSTAERVLRSISTPLLVIPARS